MGQGISDLQCCQQEPLSKRIETEFRADGFGFRVAECDQDERLPARVKLRLWASGDSSSSSAVPQIEADCDPDCHSRCKENCSASPSPGKPINMQSLSYSPVRFDDCPTIDTERSEDRYSNSSVHSARMHTRRQMLDRQDWLRSAVEGRPATLVMSTPEKAPADGTASGHLAIMRQGLQRVPAKYHLDSGRTALFILPQGRADIASITVVMDAIQVICSVTDNVLFMAQWGSHLTEMELSCAVLLKYKCDNDELGLRQVCLLEESRAAKDTFVNTLTALWLSEPRKHSAWF
eukprot:gb/GFBE01015791.1/.p1 GENE.gb/GFBE01015791.1/~~gb/GFBE01015791.1/.p1  ORF type:complete len:291 (+),score=44.94 gb/GFBE01015791.1/:1-873(+)